MDTSDSVESGAREDRSVDAEQSRLALTASRISEAHKRRFATDPAYQQMVRERGKKKIRRVEVACAQCGKTLLRQPNTVRDCCFCDRKCMYDYRRCHPGHPHTEEHKKMMSELKRQWWATHDTTETRRRIGLASKGRPGKRGPDNHHWKGGRSVTKRDGYVHIRRPDDPLAQAMARLDGYVLEHRLVIAHILGRPLRPHEDVHHRNQIKDDNRAENLVLVIKQLHGHEECCPKCGFNWRVQ